MRGSSGKEEEKGQENMTQDVGRRGKTLSHTTL